MLHHLTVNQHTFGQVIAQSLHFIDEISTQTEAREVSFSSQPAELFLTSCFPNLDVVEEKVKQVGSIELIVASCPELGLFQNHSLLVDVQPFQTILYITNRDWFNLEVLGLDEKSSESSDEHFMTGIILDLILLFFA